MAHVKLLLTLSVLVAAPSLAQPAPPGTAQTKYCMRVGSITGSNIERIYCWTRDQWAEQGVDVDAEWPREGIKTIG